ncbi:MAG: carboxypeptidase regulatory-like domain-containing protein [Acidobacteria bacterium]|nr:carboxypeptidase regulatory-like domain-containing protein [Acidobacteriota bacterium]
MSVKDQFGGAVARAKINIVGADGKARSAETDSRGTARFANTPGGQYQITVSATGFKQYREENRTIRGDETRTIDVMLEIAPIESEVEVGEKEAINAESAGAALVLNEKDIDKLPEDPAELERALQRLGVAATGEELPVTVNGIQGGKIPPKGAIQQIRVNQNVFSAQYDSPYGGGIEIFTRSSVDRFRGYLSFSFADSRLNAADPFLGGLLPFQSRTYFFSTSGPLLSKKANFYVWGSRSDSDASVVINAIVLNSALQPTEFKQFQATPSQADNIYVVVNADPTKKHKLYLSYNLVRSESSGQNVGGFSLPSRANENNFQSHYFQFSDTFLINPNVVNQTRLLASYTANDSFGGSDLPAINVLDAFFGGGSQQSTKSKNIRFDTANETSWQMGRYALAFGFRVRGEHISQNSTANFGGTYTFSGRVAPVLDVNNVPVIDPDGTIVTAEINSLESYRRTVLLGQLGFSPQRIRELGGGPSQFTISGGNPALAVSQYDLGFYMQNSYKISETVAASFGLRYEDQTNIASHFNLAPRFGLIWAPAAKEKQNPLYTLPRISIGYGLFFSRFPLNSTLNVRQASDADRRQYLINETSILDIYPNVPTVDLLNQFALPRTQRFIDGEFQSPYQSLLSITATKKMPKGFSLTFIFSRGRTFRQSFTQNINAPLAGTFDPSDPSLAVRPFGNVGNIYETRSAGKLETDRYTLSLSFPQSDKMFANLRYSYSRSKSSVVSGSGSPFDAYDLSQEFGPSSYDGVHNVGGYFYYSFPHKISFGSDFSISSGTRFNITTGRDTNGDGFFSERPSFATDLTRPGLVPTPYGVLDPNPEPGTKLIPRNLGRGESTMGFNSTISKNFGFNEDKANKKPPRQTLTFTLRVNNVFNIINKANPIGNMASPNFLRSLSPFSDGGIVTINGAPQLNFAGRSMSLSVAFGF